MRIGTTGQFVGGDWLPDENAWLGVTGTQYWDLGENVTADMKVEIRYMGQHGEANTIPLGLWDNTTGTTNRFMIQFSGMYLTAYFGNTLTTTRVSVSRSVWYTISLCSGVYMIDTTSYTVGTTINLPLHNPYVGCYHTINSSTGESVSNYAIGKYRYVKCWKNNVLVRDFRPRLYDGIWLPYDRVSKVAFPNLGTGTFTGGVDAA